VAFLAGGLTVYLLFGGWNRPHQGRPPAPDPGAAAAELQRQADLLATVLLPQAEWIRRELALPMEWEGCLPSAESLVQWNARVSAGIEGLGLQVLDGREEVISRAGKWPLQRLTLIVGGAGEILATIVIETSRSPDLPPPF
jgi:hypothetical protein